MRGLWTSRVPSVRGPGARPNSVHGVRHSGSRHAGIVEPGGATTTLQGPKYRRRVAVCHRLARHNRSLGPFRHPHLHVFGLAPRTGAVASRGQPLAACGDAGGPGHLRPLNAAPDPVLGGRVHDPWNRCGSRHGQSAVRSSLVRHPHPGPVPCSFRFSSDPRLGDRHDPPSHSLTRSLPSRTMEAWRHRRPGTIG
jgi:hypothetical protein